MTVWSFRCLELQEHNEICEYEGQRTGVHRVIDGEERVGTDAEILCVSGHCEIGEIDGVLAPFPLVGTHHLVQGFPSLGLSVGKVLAE